MKPHHFDKPLQHRSVFVAATAFLIALFCLALQTQPPPARALPVFARQYGVSCNACHSIAPKLNIIRENPPRCAYSHHKQGC